MRLAVVGKPVGHSKSPLFQSAALQKAGVSGWYSRLAVESASEALELAKELGLAGLNVTAPFKEEMAKAVDELSVEALKIGAANTVVVQEKKTIGYNTDAFGIVQAMRRSGACFAGQKALVLGAGGAARAAVYALREEGASVWIVNRSPEKAQRLAAEFDVRWCALDDESLQSLALEANLLVNTTATKEQVLKPDCLHAGLTVLESQYAGETVLVRDALAVGAKIATGLDWLLYQGMQAFEIFTGLPADEGTMRRALLQAPPRLGKSLALVGMMGSGKSSCAWILGKRLEMPHVDLDREIEKFTGMSIPAIFALKPGGELIFRQLESQLLRKFLEGPPVVLACGGGVVLREENRNLLAKHAWTVWLWASPAELHRRVGRSTDRPLLQGHAQIERFEQLLASRMDCYGQAADLILSTETQTSFIERIAYEYGHACLH